MDSYEKTVYFILQRGYLPYLLRIEHDRNRRAYTETLHKPSYASGFEIVGAEGRQSTLQSIQSVARRREHQTTLFIVRNGEKIPAGFTGQVGKGARRIVCLLYLCGDVDALGQADRVVGSFGKKLYFE